MKKFNKVGFTIIKRSGNIVMLEAKGTTSKSRFCTLEVKRDLISEGEYFDFKGKRISQAKDLPSEELVIRDNAQRRFKALTDKKAVAV